jgi:hypothetical protein
MRPSIRKGKSLPESAADFEALREARGLTYAACLLCRQPFSPANTHSALAWAETQISGMCEDCFDVLFAELGDEE